MQLLTSHLYHIKSQFFSHRVTALLKLSNDYVSHNTLHKSETMEKIRDFINFTDFRVNKSCAFYNSTNV
jgi:hypothetical protein